MRRVRVVVPIIVLSLAALSLAACDDGGGGDGENDPPGSPTDLEISVTADEFRFDPTSFQAKRDQEIDLTFTNDDTTTHTYTIEELSVDVEAAAGSSNTETFLVPDEDVIIEWHCRFHPEMSGQIFVGDPDEAVDGTGDGAAD